MRNKLKDYIIDFDRVNQLCGGDHYLPSSQNAQYPINPNPCSISKTIIKEHLRFFEDTFRSNNSSRINEDKLNYITDSLIYNKIIINKSFIREKTISEILKNKEGN